MYVILLGPPGVGKGTQGVLLAEAFGWERVVTGDLLRQARADETEIGREAQRYMDAGELVPDQVVVELVAEKLKPLPADCGVLFDGYPRNAAQASALAEILEELGRAIDQVVVLTADDQILVERIAGRRSCVSCGAVFNVFVDPSESGELCDRCNSPLHHRPDDQEDTVRHRLDVYREQTQPLIAFYEQSSVEVHSLDGSLGVDQVQDAVRNALGVGSAAR